MPIYEYKCQDCEAFIEKRQNIADEPLTKCEKCGGSLEKQWSLSGFQFKGEGWYVTDYSKNKTPANSGEKSSAAESTVKPDSASNTKSDASTSGTKSADPKKD